MSKKQWGNGYYRGLRESEKNSESLAGLWFHSRKEGKINWQGKVLKQIHRDHYIIQLYSWMDGCPTIRKVESFDAIKDWDFYATDKEMRLAWHKEEGLSMREFEENERAIEAENKLFGR